MTKQKPKIKEKSKRTWNAHTIDRWEIKTKYMLSTNMSVQWFLRDEHWWSENQVMNGNTKKQTGWRQADKVAMKEEVEAKIIETVKKEEIKKKSEFQLTLQWAYRDNTIAILEKLKVEWEKMPIKDRILVNDEIRTQLWIPSTISSTSFKTPDDWLADDPSSILLNRMNDEIQNIKSDWDWKNDEAERSVD